MALGRWIGAVLAAALTLTSVPRAALAACQLVKIGELSVATEHNQPPPAVTINGHAVRMLVDSGAEKSALWRPALESLGLHAVGSGVKFFGVNGPDEAGLVTVREFGLGGYVVHDLRLFVVGRDPNTSFVGLLGEDFLSSAQISLSPTASTSHAVRARSISPTRVGRHSRPKGHRAPTEGSADCYNCPLLGL